MKKRYSSPKVISAQQRMVSKNICGWHTQCGSQVRARS